MPIQQVHVENFKSFSELDIDLSRFNVIIGSNAAGKSNFISIFKFLRDIARHGLANAIALQGGQEYIQNAKIGHGRDLAIRVVYVPDQKLAIIHQNTTGNGLLGIQSCESSYEFTIRFNADSDGFVIIKDRLVIGYEVSSCERKKTVVEKNRILGHGEIEV
ncbi:MAG: ATPase, partial [Methanomicrobiales archaeon HGW-Methanomicrobiales-5]